MVIAEEELRLPSCLHTDKMEQTNLRELHWILFPLLLSFCLRLSVSLSLCIFICCGLVVTGQRSVINLSRC